MDIEKLERKWQSIECALSVIAGVLALVVLLLLCSIATFPWL